MQLKYLGLHSTKLAVTYLTPLCDKASSVNSAFQCMLNVSFINTNHMCTMKFSVMIKLGFSLKVGSRFLKILIILTGGWLHTSRTISVDDNRSLTFPHFMHKQKMILVAFNKKQKRTLCSK